jgi:uncharacterized protein involved in exopolysaccharide biosynthesis
MNIYYAKKNDKVAIQVTATSPELAIEISQAMDQAMLCEGWLRVVGTLTGKIYSTTPPESIIDVDSLRHAEPFKKG